MTLFLDEYFYWLTLTLTLKSLTILTLELLTIVALKSLTILMLLLMMTCPPFFLSLLLHCYDFACLENFAPPLNAIKNKGKRPFL